MNTDGIPPVAEYRGYRFIVVDVHDWYVMHIASQFVIGIRHDVTEARLLVDNDIAENSR